jgi:pyruvate dehydrogenase E2 component (dihydrolipoamide acetyltransferase)
MFLIKIPLKLKAAQGVIEKWIAREGHVKKGDILLFLKTHDEIVEIRCPEDMTLLKISALAGSIVHPGQIIGVLGQSGQDISNIKNLLNEPNLSSPKPQVTEEIDIPAQDIKSTAPKEVKMTPESKPAPPAGKVIPILMPQAGQTMEEGTLLSWKVKEGDRISVGQAIFEIETDKATMEVEAVDAGRLAKIVVQAGQTVAVRVPVAYLAESDADVQAYLASMSEDKPSAAAVAPVQKAESPSAFAGTQAAPAVSETGRIMASPAARKIASQRGIDLATVPAGSGPGGRIVSADVEKAKAPAGGGIRRPLSKMRKAIAGNLLYSKQNIPHFYAKLTIDAQALFDTYKQTKEKYKCSVNDFVTMACARAIREYPAFRSQFKDNEIIEFPDVNIGIAVGTDQGLTVPVLIRADQMTLREIADKTRQIAASAREGKLEGMGLGIFTITNLGMFGVEEFSAIINPPESAILAVGAAREGIKVENGQILPTRLMTVILSSDHRVIDGVLSAKFLQTLKDLLEHPQQLAGL